MAQSMDTVSDAPLSITYAELMHACNEVNAGPAVAPAPGVASSLSEQAAA